MTSSKRLDEVIEELDIRIQNGFEAWDWTQIFAEHEELNVDMGKRIANIESSDGLEVDARMAGLEQHIKNQELGKELRSKVELLEKAIDGQTISASFHNLQVEVEALEASRVKGDIGLSSDEVLTETRGRREQLGTICSNAHAQMESLCAFVHGLA